MKENKRDEAEPQHDVLASQQHCRVENKPGLEALNKHIEENGLFTDEDAFSIL